MVDHRGRIRARQISIVNTRCRLHSPLYRNTRSTVSTSSRSSIEEYDESQVVRSRSPSRSPTRNVQRQMFFGDDYADTDSDCPMKEVDFHSDVVKPSTTTDFVRTTTTTTTKTVVCEEQMHLESDVETNTSSVAMDNAWEVSTADMKRRSTADSAPSSDFSASPCERKKSRHHVHYARPTFSSALAQSTGMSDTLARMKLRKQEVEMANVVEKVQKQMIAMESMLKELQLEHRVKCELLERQIEHTNRVEVEKAALQRELDDATRQLVALQSHKEGETTQNVNYLSVAMTAFMNQSEQAQNMMLNQLKALDLPQQSSQVKENNADVLQQLTKYHQDVLAALQSTPVKVAEPATLVRRSNTLATEAPVANAVPVSKSMAPVTSGGFTSQRLIGVLIFCLGVGGGLLAQSTKENQSAPVQAPIDVDAIVEKLKQVYTPAHLAAPVPVAPTESKWVEVVAPVEPIAESAKAVEPVVDVPVTIEPVELVEEAKPEAVKEVVPVKEDVLAKPASSAIVPSDVSGQIALMMKLNSLKKPAASSIKVDKPMPVEVEVEPLVSLPVALPEPAVNVSNVVVEKSDERAIDDPMAQPTPSGEVVDTAADSAEAATIAEATTEVAAVAEEATEQLLLVEEDSVDDVIAIENSTESAVSGVISTVDEVVTVELSAIGAVDVVEIFEDFPASQNTTDEKVVEDEPVFDDVESVEVPEVAEPVVETVSVAPLPTSSFDALAMALRSLINPSRKEADVAVPSSQPKATLATLASKSSSRRLWKREVKATDIVNKLPLEDVTTAAVAFESERAIESLEMTSSVAEVVETAVAAEVDVIQSVEAATLSWESTSKEHWADKVYANMSSEVAAASIPAEVPAAIEAAQPKPSLLAHRSKVVLPTCAWNTSIAAEVSWNPFYEPKATASMVEPLVAVDLDETADATEASVAVDEGAVVVAEAPLEDALVTTTADVLEPAGEEAIAVEVDQVVNSISADVEQAEEVVVALEVAEALEVVQAEEVVAAAEVAEAETVESIEVAAEIEVADDESDIDAGVEHAEELVVADEGAEAVEAEVEQAADVVVAVEGVEAETVESIEVAAVAEEVDSDASVALEVEPVDNIDIVEQVDNIDAVEQVEAVDAAAELLEAAPEAIEPEVAEVSEVLAEEVDVAAPTVDDVDAVVGDEVVVEELQAPVGVAEEVVDEPAAEETQAVEEFAHVVATEDAEEAVEVIEDVGEAVDAVEDVLTAVDEPEAVVEESNVEDNEVEATAEFEAQVPAVLALPAVVESEAEAAVEPQVEAVEEQVEEVAEEVAVESDDVYAVEVDETLPEVDEVAASAVEPVTEPVVDLAPIAEEEKAANASFVQDPVTAFLAVVASSS